MNEIDMKVKPGQFFSAILKEYMVRLAHETVSASVRKNIGQLLRFFCWEDGE
jgi:hypothetical protein